MPTFNHAAFIGEAIDSVLAQSYINWELIVVNNFSTDKTDSIVAAYGDPRIRMVNFANGGIIAKSRNHGLRMASGEFLALLDSDDIWEADKLAIQLQVMERHPNILLCSTALTIFPGGLRSPLLRKWSRPLSLKSLKRHNIVYNSSILMRRSSLDFVGYFDEEIGLRTVEDYEYWLRVLQFKDQAIYFIDRPLLRYRVSQSNASGMGQQINVAAERVKIDTLAAKRFSGTELQGFLRSKRSELARRVAESGCIDESLRPSNQDLLLADRWRMSVSRLVKNIVRKIKA